MVVSNRKTSFIKNQNLATAVVVVIAFAIVCCMVYASVRVNEWIVTRITIILMLKNQ